MALAFVFFAMAIPYVCGYLWGVHEANAVLQAKPLSPAEADRFRTELAVHWATGGLLLGFILVVYAVMMRGVFLIVGGVVNGAFKLTAWLKKPGHKGKDRSGYGPG